MTRLCGDPHDRTEVCFDCALIDRFARVVAAKDGYCAKLWTAVTLVAEQASDDQYQDQRHLEEHAAEPLCAACGGEMGPRGCTDCGRREDDMPCGHCEDCGRRVPDGERCACREDR